MAPACPNFGFVARFRLHADVDAARWLVSLHDELLITRGLVASAGGGNREVVIVGEGVQATDADRDAVVSWLARRTDIERFTVGPVCDVGSAA